MEYHHWRQDIFRHSWNADSTGDELLPVTESLSPEEQLDHVDRVLEDPEIHQLYHPDQIGIGLQVLFYITHSNISRSYLDAREETRRVASIQRLALLYTNYFKRYCNTPISRIGYDHVRDEIDSLCYMFWDCFVLSPNAASPSMIDAAYDVMEKAIRIPNDNCIVSAIHGLGHWALYDSRSAEILGRWLENPSTQNQVVLEYAQQAMTGCIQ